MTRTRTFQGVPQSVAAARRFATETLAGAAPDTLEAVELMGSELATNCVRHTNTGFELTIVREPEQIRVEVTDDAGGTPRMRSPAVTDPTGRGLQIVELLSGEWGVQRAAAALGKTVWFTIAAPEPSRA
jgi:serine/threonine-protein kinase RsbW